MEACLRRCSQGSILCNAFRPFSCKLSHALPSPSSSFHSGGRLVKRAYDALLLDAGGTLLQLEKPVEETYACIGKKYGLKASPAEIKQGFKKAFSGPWPEKLRYQGDGKPFWKLVVAEATGCSDNDYFEEVYEWYANGDAWRLPDLAFETMSNLKDAGVRMAVVSNFDTRLRKLLKDLNVIDLFDAVIVSSEVGYEKPDARIFKAALDQMNVETDRAVHVGDDEDADKAGANAIGIDCCPNGWMLKRTWTLSIQKNILWSLDALEANADAQTLWGKDIKSFSDVQSRILVSKA